MKSRVEKHQTKAWRSNNPASEWSDDQAFKERGDWNELSTGVSDRLQLRRSHAPCHTHTDTGRHRREGGKTGNNTNTKTQTPQYPPLKGRHLAAGPACPGNVCRNPRGLLGLRWGNEKSTVFPLAHTPPSPRGIDNHDHAGVRPIPNLRYTPGGHLW